MHYDSLIVTLILAVEVLDFWIHYQKEREKKFNKIRRMINRYIKEASHDSRKTAR
jgi:hypothetical protein